MCGETLLERRTELTKLQRYGGSTMAVPKQKKSKSRRNQRRSHDALVAPTYREDKQTGEYARPHHVDLKTGMYRGRQVLNITTDAA